MLRLAEPQYRKVLEKTPYILPSIYGMNLKKMDEDMALVFDTETELIMIFDEIEEAVDADPGSFIIYIKDSYFFTKSEEGKCILRMYVEQSENQHLCGYTQYGSGDELEFSDFIEFVQNLL